MVRLAETIDNPFALVHAYFGISYVHLRQGAFHQTIAPLERALNLCHDWQYLLALPGVISMLSAAYAMSRRMVEARSLLPQAEVQVTPISVVTSMGYVWMSEAYLRVGLREEAAVRMRHALAISRERKQRGAEAWAMYLIAELNARGNPAEVEPAKESYRQALALADDLGMRPLQAHCHHGFGTLYVKLGQQEPARRELSTAIDLYRTMDMTFWLPQAEAALARVG
jgi:tetratricopeptide (TPR) repeat protein